MVDLTGEKPTISGQSKESDRIWFYKKIERENGEDGAYFALQDCGA